MRTKQAIRYSRVGAPGRRAALLSATAELDKAQHRLFRRAISIMAACAALLLVVLVLTGCNPEPVYEGRDWDILRGRNTAAEYETERDKREPGYHAKMDALRADPGYLASMARLDREMERTDRLLAESEWRTNMEVLRRTINEPVVIHHYHGHR